MKLKRLVQAALPSMVCFGGFAFGLITVAPTSADVVTDDLNQSQANRLSIFHDYSISAVGSSTGEISKSSGGGLVGPFLGNYATTDSAIANKNWFVAGTPLFGYDSNPEARQHAVESLFAGVDVSAGYATELATENPTNIFFSYNLNGAVYEGMVKEANVFQQSASAGIRHWMLGDTIVVSGQLKDQLTLEHGAALLNSLDVIPSLEAFWFPNISTEVALDYAHMEYFFPVAAIVDPDTERNTLYFNLHLYPLPQGRNAEVPESPDQLTDILRSSLHSAVLGFGHTWNKADGSAYEYQSNRIVFGLDGIRPLKSPDLVLNLEYAHEWQNYLNSTPITSPSLSKPILKYRRDDHLDVLTIRADARLADLANNRGTVAGFLQWDMIRDFSVIKARDFNEFIVSAGITFRY